MSTHEAKTDRLFIEGSVTFSKLPHKETGNLRAFLFVEARFVVTVLKFPSEQLNADDGKHKLQEKCHQHYVSDAFNCYNHALDDMLKGYKYT